ncbi:myb-like protein X isoform X2 [Dreissena polymorpha]|uniref:myb-like protein X isoform X2 n=1 Tax=Dreissena polymorpha TaxID=45954 RepID=UPI002264D65F|nr:myb-like protein X isoform X2 [Dreissena polymorpha]
MEGEEQHGKKVRLNDERERGQTEANESPRAESSQQRKHPEDDDEGRHTRSTGTSTCGSGNDVFHDSSSSKIEQSKPRSGEGSESNSHENDPDPRLENENVDQSNDSDHIDFGEARGREVEKDTTKGILREILDESIRYEAPANNGKTDDDKIQSDTRILAEPYPNEAPANSVETDNEKIKYDTKTKRTDVKSHSLNSRVGSDSDHVYNSDQVEDEVKTENHVLTNYFETDDDKLNENKHERVTTPTATDKATDDHGHLKWEKDTEPSRTNADYDEQVEDNKSEKSEDETLENDTKEETVDDEKSTATSPEDGYTIKTPFKSKAGFDENEQAPEEVEHKMEPVVQSNNTKQATMQSKSQPDKQTLTISKKQDTRKVTLQRKPVSSAPNLHTKQQKSQSARLPTRGYPFPRENTQTSRAISRTSGKSVPSRPRTTIGFNTEQRKREKDFFHAELKRLKESLRSESKKISKPKVRDFYPDVFTSLEPYYNTYTANYLINMPTLGYKEKQPQEAAKEKKEDEVEEEPDIMFTTRKTAIGLCDPWQSLNMDRQVLPKLETAEIRRRRIEQMHHLNDPKPKSPREKKPEAKQGSTRLPKFPVIHPPNSEISTKELVYSDVPMLRDELIRSFSHFGEDRKKSDYQRTRQDFFRMELDRLDEYHSKSRPHMRAAYFAYLQNTPGSRKAIYDCMKEMSTPRKKKEVAPQAVA